MIHIKDKGAYVMKDFHYIKLHFGVLKMNDLKLSSRVIYSFLYYLSAINNPMTIRNDFIADKLGVSIDTVKRGLNELKKVKLIKVTNSNRYRQIEVKQINTNNYINGVIEDFKKETDNNITPEVDQVLDRIFNQL